MFKKRWSDGLQDDFDHLNEFEFKLGCFGGDGGSSGGGGYGGNLGGSGYGDGDSDTGGMGSADDDTGFGGGGGGGNDAVSDALADALNTNIGDYSVDDTNVDMADTGQYGAEPSISSFADLQSQVSNLANQSLASQNSTAVADFQNQVASGMFSGPPSAPSSYGTPASYGPNAGVPTGYSVGIPAMDLDIGINSPISDNFSGYTPTGTPTSVSDALAQALGINNNIAGFNIAPGMVGNAPGLIGTTKFREGGAVEYPGYGQSMSGGGGIMSVLEPFGNYLNEQIDVQRVDPFLETVSNAAYQEFGIKPDQGGGFFSGGFYKDNLGGDFSGMPPPLPAVQQPVMNTEPSGPVAGLSTFGPDVGNGGLFGGIPGANNSMTMGTGLASTVAPSPDGLNPSIPSGVSSTPVPQDVRSAYEAAVKSAQEQRKNGFMGRVVLPGEMGFDQFAQGYNYRLNNPNLQPLTSVGNDGFALFPEYEKFAGEPMQLPIKDGYTGQPMQLPYDPTPMNPLIYDSLAAAGGLPDFAGSAQNYFGNNIDPRGPVTPMTPEDIFRQAQMRNMQQDVKSPEVQAYLDNIIQTGGRPTMMAPSAGPLLSAGSMNDAANLAAFNVGTNPPKMPSLSPASDIGGLVDAYGNPASFSPAELEAMLAATPISSFQQGPNLSRPAPVPILPLQSGTTVSPTGQILHFGPNRGGLQVARSQFGLL